MRPDWRGFRVGDRCRLIDVSLKTFGSEPYLVRLGDHVTLTSGVRFLTHDGGVWVLRDRYPDLDVIGEIVVEDNVFIGVNALILPNVRIGRDSVVAAGSVVTRSVPPGSVVAGVPARVISFSGRLRASKSGIGPALSVSTRSAEEAVVSRSCPPSAPVPTPRTREQASRQHRCAHHARSDDSGPSSTHDSKGGRQHHEGEEKHHQERGAAPA